MTLTREGAADAVARLFAEGLHVEVSEAGLDLIEAGLLDSLLLVELIVEIERRFGMTVPMDDLELENFRSIERIAAYLVRQKERSDADAA